MSLEVHAVRSGSETHARVWDARLKAYRTQAMSPGRLRQELNQLALAGGLHPSAERMSAIADMIERAVASPEKNGWRNGAALHTTERNALRRSRLAYELARQLTDDLFDQELESHLMPLGAEARNFLVCTFVLRELVRGSGTAVLTVHDGGNSGRQGCRDVAHALLLVNELRQRLPDVSVDVADAAPDGSRLITFALL